jgi:hypothetical protein
MKVMAAPQKVGHDLGHSLGTIKASGAHVVGTTEMDLGKSDEVALARRVLGKGWGVFAEDKGGHSREIPILVHLLFWLKVISHKTIPLSPDVTGKGAGNDRWLNILRIKVFRWVWIIMNLHTNAEVQRVAKSPHTLIHGPRLIAYREGMKIFEHEVQKALDDPEVDGRVVVLGDLNMLDVDEGAHWEFSPHQVFRRLGMHWISERVVYVAWGPGLKPVGKTQVTKPNTKINPADHARLAKRLRRARR